MNNNLARHQILSDMIMYMLANNYPQGTFFDINEIASLRKPKKKRNSAITYLLATGHLLPTPSNGIAKGISLSPTGKDAYYSEHFKEIGKKQIARFWNNFITVTFSAILTIVAVATFITERPKSEVQIEEMQQTLKQHSLAIDSLRAIQKNQKIHVPSDTSKSSSSDSLTHKE